MKPPIPAASSVHFGLDRGGCRRQHHRDFSNMATHHCHVAGVIVNAILLLVGGVMLLVDNDKAEIRVGKEERRPGTGTHAHLPASNRMPGPRAQSWAQL